MRFTEFDLDEELLDGISASGYETATPIQQKVIPPILKGKDIIASAQTGTGKTAAFLLPMIHRLLQHRVDGQVSALIIVPTRELAIQIAQHVEGLSYFTNISSIAVYGGNDGSNFITEKRALQMGADIVVCTPGRMIAHLNMGYVAFKGLQMLVLDEADRMLDMGFQDDIKKIISFLPVKRQTLLFSATMPDKIRSLARTILHEPEEINIAISKPPEKIQQKAYVVYDTQKLGLILHLLKTTTYKRVLIFCSRKQTVKQLVKGLVRAGLKTGEMHSDLEQSVREETLSQFASGRLPILVATDILSRGIDIDTIDIVVNFDVPHEGEDYVHRIGRTARAEAEGMAVTLIGEKEQNRFAAIETLLERAVDKSPVPKELGETPSYHPRSRHNIPRQGKRHSHDRKYGRHHGKPSGPGHKNNTGQQKH